MKIPIGWDLPLGIATRLGESAGRQRILTEDEHLLLVLHRVPQSGSSEREGVFFWRLPTSEWRASTGVVGLIALREHVESYARTVAHYESLYRKATTSTDYFEVLEGIAPLHRASANLYATLQKARETAPLVNELISLSDEASDVERIAELLQIETKYALDAHVARQAEEQTRLARDAARSSRRLSLLAAVLLPIITVTSFYGTNMTNGQSGSPQQFWIIFFFAAYFGLALGFMWTRKR